MPQAIAKTKTGIGRLAAITERIGLFEVKLYSTYIYSEMENEITLATGGWETLTTSRYINQALRYQNINGRVNIKNGVMQYNGQPFIGGVYTLTKNNLG